MKSVNKIYIILSIFVLTSLLLVGFLVWPISKEIIKISDDVVLAKNSMVTLSNQIIETENFKKNYLGYKSNLEKIDQLFVNKNDMVSFFEFLDDSAIASNLTSQISLTTAPVNSKQNNMVFTLSSKGSFSDVLDFARKIEVGPYLLSINNLVIQDAQEFVNGKPVIAKNYFDRNVSAIFTIKVFTN